LPGCPKLLPEQQRVAEVTKNRFLESLTVENIEIGTEELEGHEGQKRNVSTITIVLKKG
jgi:DNA-binding protein Alba